MIPTLSDKKKSISHQMERRPRLDFGTDYLAVPVQTDLNLLNQNQNNLYLNNINLEANINMEQNLGNSNNIINTNIAPNIKTGKDADKQMKGKEEIIPKTDIKKNIDSKFLQEINNIRELAGLRPFKRVICITCKALNVYLTKDCPHNMCRICFGSHLTSNCAWTLTCQICGAIGHNAKICELEKALKLRAKQLLCCQICNKYGHSATNCKLGRNRSKALIRGRYSRRGFRGRRGWFKFTRRYK